MNEQEGTKINTNFRPRQWRSFRSESLTQSLKQHEELVQAKNESTVSSGQASTGQAEEPVIIKRTGLVRRMASQILSASNSVSCASSKSVSSSQLGPKENSTFKTAVEDLKKVMNSQEFKQLNASIYSEVKKKAESSASSKSDESPQTAVKNKLTELNGSFHLEETEKGIKIRVKQPHLVISSTSKPAEKEDATKTSIRIFPLRLGRTTIGSSSTNDIVLDGTGIEDEHCYIENVLVSETFGDDLAKKDTRSAHLVCCKKQVEPDGTTESAKQEPEQTKPRKKSNKLINLVTLYPLAELCAVDGVLIQDPYRLNCGEF